MMKKILSLLFVIFLVFFLWPRGVLATAPVCNPMVVDLSDSSKGSNCEGWLNPGSQSKCDKNAPGTVFCDAGSVMGWVGGGCCWPKGLTTSNPVCPDGYLQEATTWAVCPQFAGFCCSKDSTGYFCDRSGTCGAGGGFCDCFQSSLKSPTKPKDACSDVNYKYNSATNRCERFVFVESQWDLIQDCGNKITVIVNGVGYDHYDGVSTAIGCVPVENLTDFLKFVLKWVFFASGGIIVLMVIATGYTIITSQGNPEKLQAAKENIVALLSGLAMIAFSLILLQVIGQNVLGLPTF